MKKQLIAIASVAMLAGALSFSSCKKDDTTAPTITITGGNTLAVSLNGTYAAPSATAADDVDGDISTSITIGGDVVDVNVAGTYNVSYSVTDAAGNSASETLVVTVANDAASFDGIYNVHDTVPSLPAFNYTIRVTPSSTVNNRLEFDADNGNGFAFYDNNINIYATVSGSGVGATVTLPFQVANAIGTPAENHDFQGNGTVVVASPKKFTITYTDHNITQAATATGCVMTLTHQ